jgi:hypothetical protein
MDQTRRFQKRIPNEQLEDIHQQILKGADANKPTIVMGDANLCMDRWKDANYTHNDLANEVLGTLAQSGMTPIELGPTYLADRLSPEGHIIESALDHNYASENILNEATMRKTDESSTDHVPIFTEVLDGRRKDRKEKIIVKRCMKEFTKEKWMDCLAGREWERLAETEDLEDMTKDFSEQQQLLN